MKYLFLDIDGVLNDRRTRQRLRGCIGIDPLFVKQLNSLISQLQPVTVVLSSTWRLFDGLAETQKALTAAGFAHQLADSTPVLQCERGLEIQAWMDKNGVTADQIVILDDDADMEHLLPRLVQTSGYNARPLRGGLSAKNVREAISLFGAGA